MTPLTTLNKKFQAVPSKVLFMFFFAVGAVIMGMVGIWYYHSVKTELQQTLSGQNQQQKILQEKQETVAALKNLILVPDEEPVIATITDGEYLAKTSNFYKDAQKGDLLVLFPQAKKAFIYRPSSKVLVNAGPLVLGDAPTPAQQ